jgi:hypothetical protein
MYENLKKFAEKKGISFTKASAKETFKADKKGKVLSTTERNDLVITIAKDLGYLE